MIVASLPMYDWPEIRPHTDAFWQGLTRHAGIAGDLNRENLYEDLWAREDLTFSQTCGYPFTHKFNSLLQYIATPHYCCDGCVGPDYSSIIFAREKKPIDEFYGAVAAVNSLDSMSGMLALKLVCAPYMRDGEFFRRTRISGGHRNSLRDVRNKFADVCAIDSVCVALARKYCPEELEGLVEIARSPLVPALPFVTRAGDVTRLQNALHRTFMDENLRSVREALLLSGVSILPDLAYNKILDLENDLPLFNL
jgi:ABC-type phosphate/phosphonate transport system substrate-binding protein